MSSNYSEGFEGLVECLGEIISKSLHWEDLPALKRLRLEIRHSISGDLMDVYAMLDSQEDLGGGGVDELRVGYALQNTGNRVVGMRNLLDKVELYIQELNAAEKPDIAA